jgi:hypothetical protein
MQTASLVLGILALAFLFLPGFNLVLSPMLGVAALVMGLISRKSATDAKEDATRGTAGLATGAIALALSIGLIGGCYVLIKDSGCCDWKEKRAAAGVDDRFEELSEEFKEDMREEIRREVREEMERTRQDRIQDFKNRQPWTDEELREQFEERIDDWIDWFEQMPIQQDLDEAAKPAPRPPDKAAGPDAEVPPGKKSKAIPDTKYPFGSELE